MVDFRWLRALAPLAALWGKGDFVCKRQLFGGRMTHQRLKNETFLQFKREIIQLRILGSIKRSCLRPIE